MKFQPKPPRPKKQSHTWPSWHITQGVYIDFSKFSDQKAAEKFRDLREKHGLASWELGMQMIEHCLEEAANDLLSSNTDQAGAEAAPQGQKDLEPASSDVPTNPVHAS